MACVSDVRTLAHVAFAYARRMNAWEGRHAAERARQWPTLATLVERVRRSESLDGLVLLGSMAAGTFDELSDIDAVVVVRAGFFDSAWDARHELSRGCIARWDLPGGLMSTGHNWLTRDLVKVDCTIIDPDGREKPLAAPYVVCAGSPNIAARFPAASLADVQEAAHLRQAEQNAHPVDPETMPYGELIDWKLSDFKYAVRRAPRPGTGD
jgi:predicted nucleotidyltransferase